MELLKPLSDATLRFSSKANPTIADVVGIFEELDAHFRQVEDDEDISEAWREAARRGSAVCSTYYGLSDDTKIYYLAVLLHPNMRKKLMTAMKWEQEWIENAVETLKTVYEDRYRSFDESQSQSQDQDEDSSKRKKNDRPETFVERQLRLIDAKQQTVPADPVSEWCDVDVERLFSKAGHHVTPLRHRLKAIKLGMMVTVGAWFRENWIPDDLLSKYYRERKQQRLAEKAKEKGKKRAIDNLMEDDTSKRSRTQDTELFEDEDYE
ncbi:hypothetical protein CF326_g6851 [Tilletia indica]|nr:hypothetical protein CF326_g6851 [Tilletia indica]